MICNIISFICHRYRKQRAKLIIYELSLADAGVYTVEAVNADMQTSESITLVVTGESVGHRESSFIAGVKMSAYADAVCFSFHSVIFI